MDESHFLKSRQEREEARATRQNAEASDDTVAREEFVAEVSRLQQQIEAALLPPGTANIEEATNYYRLLQAHIQRGTDVFRLPPHEVKSANTALAKCLAQIEEVRNAAKPVKKFAFSKKKTVAISAAADEGPATPTDSTSTTAASASSAQVTDPALTYADRSDAVVFVAHGKAAFVRRLKNCLVLVLPIAGSCFLSDCENCTVYAACHQMRIKSCRDTSVYVWCSSIPVIENSRNIAFGPYSAWAGLLKTDPAAVMALEAGAPLTSHDEWVTHVGRISDIDHARQSFRRIDDFDWLKQQQSPNWRVLAEEEYKVCDEAFVC